jgi:hypothetical protein
MAGTGGARPGAGRKPKHEEDRARRLCCSAIIEKYGSLEKGLTALLASGDTALVKFVFEHAIGKPTDKIDFGNKGTGNVYVFELPKNGRELAEDAIKHANGNGNGHHTN